MLRRTPFQVLVLSLDVANDAIRGDLTNAETLQFWTTLVKASYVVGIVGGPPCETWSAAREGPPGPPPLRSPTRLWGLGDLTKTEW